MRIQFILEKEDPSVLDTLEHCYNLDIIPRVGEKVQLQTDFNHFPAFREEFVVLKVEWYPQLSIRQEQCEVYVMVEPVS
jgi:hypothetical protein